MTKETRALIEAAEWALETLTAMGHKDMSVMVSLQTAISSAKAAEEGVETKFRIEGKRYEDSEWEHISLAEPRNYNEALKLAEGWKYESPIYIAYLETRIIQKDTYTTVISVREKEGL